MRNTYVSEQAAQQCVTAVQPYMYVHFYNSDNHTAMCNTMLALPLVLVACSDACWHSQQSATAWHRAHVPLHCSYLLMLGTAHNRIAHSDQRPAQQLGCWSCSCSQALMPLTNATYSYMQSKAIGKCTARESGADKAAARISRNTKPS